ncbi:MAG: nuclear transport factor 2 family protein [Pseudorhodoplanes sp.]
MNREAMLNVMREGYAARVKGDVDGLLASFTPDAKFRLNASSPQKAAVVHACAGAGEMRTSLEQLVDAFEFLSCDIVDSIVEGSKAAIRIRFKVRARHTGNVAVTESLDLIEFRDGKISSYTQFFDTAIADRLAAPAASAAS